MRLGHPSNVKSSLTATRHVIRAVTKFQLPSAVNQAYKRQRSPNPFALKSMHPVLSGTLCKPLLRVQNTHHSVTRSTIQAHVAKNFNRFKLMWPRIAVVETTFRGGPAARFLPPSIPKILKPVCASYHIQWPPRRNLPAPSSTPPGTHLLARLRRSPQPLPPSSSSHRPRPLISSAMRR